MTQAKSTPPLPAAAKPALPEGWTPPFSIPEHVQYVVCGEHQEWTVFADCTTIGASGEQGKQAAKCIAYALNLAYGDSATAALPVQPAASPVQGDAALPDFTYDREGLPSCVWLNNGYRVSLHFSTPDRKPYLKCEKSPTYHLCDTKPAPVPSRATAKAEKELSEIAKVLPQGWYEHLGFTLAQRLQMLADSRLEIAQERDDLEEKLEQASQATAATPWQPIETAPTIDDTPIIVVVESTAANTTYGDGGYRHTVLAYWEDCWKGFGSHVPIENLAWRITLWQPFPDAPPIHAELIAEAGRGSEFRSEEGECS